jgi:hypothetical protein
MTISASSVLVELNISVWTANKLDKNATNTVIADSAAQVSDAAQVRKNLMAGTSARKKIADFAAGCRLWHNTRTLPWSDKGPRLLPTSLFMDYKQEMNARRDMFEEMTRDFIGDYPNLQSIAQNSLGTLFNPDDYPSPEEVRDKFGFRLVFSPVPESGDFRLDIPQQDMDEMKRTYDRAFDDRLASAMRTPWDKLHALITTMTNKLHEPEGDDNRRWHDSFVTNAEEMCDMLKHLNVTKDPELERARQALATAMRGVSIDVVSSDPAIRTDLKDKLDQMLKGYEW